MKNEIQQDSTNQKIVTFKPTPVMIRWFETAVELGQTSSISDVAKAARVDRTNWYLWQNKPGFVEWWDAQWQKFFTLNRWRLNAIGMKQAERNYDYWHDMMVVSGNMAPEFSEEATFVWRKK